MRRFVLGIAGHVDHGKTALVKRLTGIDTDRIPEEKKRGMSIELGFAPLHLSDEFMACIVDVPGHEKFIQTMLRGAAGMDAAILVVAATEGIKPQTVEHLQILKLLGIKRIITVITKIDAVDPSNRKEKISEIEKKLIRDHSLFGEMISVSSISGEGIPQLLTAITKLGQSLSSPPANSLYLPIDRVFSRAGFGTVITGTCTGSPIEVGEELFLISQRRRVQIKRIEVFNEPFSRIEPNCRVALNLSGVHKEEILPGDLLIREKEITPFLRYKADLEWLNPNRAEIYERSRLVGFLGGSSHPVRIRENELRFSKPVYVRKGDHLILRRESPPTLLGCAVIRKKSGDSRLVPIKEQQQKPAFDPSDPLIRSVEEQGLLPPTISELSLQLKRPEGEIRWLFQEAERKGMLRRITSDLYVSEIIATELKSKATRYFENRPTLTLSEWKNMVQVSRKFAVPYLEYLDREKVTLCKPDRSRVKGPHLRSR